MKALLVTDIHANYEEAKTAHRIVNPDIILDCGDHEDIFNIFETTPHFFIKGNHEPSSISFDVGNYLNPPYPLPSGMVMRARDGNSTFSFAGVSGNYSSRNLINAVNKRDLNALIGIPSGSLDVLLLHESPLSIDEDSASIELAKQITEQIDRIHPRYVFAGHFGKSRTLITPGKVAITNLEDIRRGYSILDINGKDITFKPVSLVHYSAYNRKR